MQAARAGGPAPGTSRLSPGSHALCRWASIADPPGTRRQFPCDHPPPPFCQCRHLKGVVGAGFRISFILKNRVFVMSSFRWSSLHSMGSSRPSPDRKEEATPEMSAWIWTYGVIMREEGEIICKVDEGFLRVFSAGWGDAGLVGVLTAIFGYSDATLFWGHWAFQGIDLV